MDLSYIKTLSLLKTHNTAVIAIYMIRKRGDVFKCKFLECRGGGLGQPFFISIPEKFNLSVSLGLGPTEVFISPVGSEIVSRQLEYLTKIRGTLDSDLVSVSSSFICHLTQSSQCYRIMGQFDESYQDSQPTNQVQSLVQKVESLGETEEVVPPPDGTVLPVVPDLPSVLEPQNPLTVRHSSFFDEIELGLVYISLDLHTFYANASTVLQLLGEKYSSLEDNELDVRQEKIDCLSRLFKEMAERFKEVDDILLKRDINSRHKLDTLSKLLKRLSVIETSSSKKKPSTDDLKFQIQTIVAEEHINSLRIKDSAHDTLELCDILCTQILDKIKGLKTEVQEMRSEDESLPKV